MAIINGRGRVGIRKRTVAAAPSIIMDGLKLYLDAGKTASYAGTGTVWTDLSGNGNNGSLRNSGSGLNYSSANGGILQFDGLNDYVNVTFNSMFPIGSQSRTLCSFFNVGSLGIGREIFGIGGNGSAGSRTALWVDSSNKIGVECLSADVVTTNWSGINTWVYLCAVLPIGSTTVGSFKIYVNGVEQSTSVSNGNTLINSTNQALTIGSIPTYTGGYFFAGNISNVQLYNKALSASEVLQNYNALKTRFYPQVADSDAQAFIYAANIQNTTQANAVNTLVTSLKSAGIWTKMKAVYPFVGGSAASHKWNLKDPRDLDAAFRLAFTAGWIHSSTGAKANGTSDYAETFLNPSTVFADFKNNSHLSVYTKIQNPTRDGWDIGVGNSTTGDSLFGLSIKRPTWSTYTNPIIYDFGNYTGNGRLITTYNDARGFWIGSTTASNSHALYRNGVSLVTSGNIASGTITNLTMNIGRLNTTSAPYYYLDNQYAFATIGDGLTVTEAANFYTAVQAYQTSLGRQV